MENRPAPAGSTVERGGAGNAADVDRGAGAGDVEEAVEGDAWPRREVVRAVERVAQAERLDDRALRSADPVCGA